VEPLMGGRPSCAIFDLDGVLLDTEPFYTRASSEVVQKWGKTFDWSLKANMIGRPAIESARYLVAALELPVSPEEYLSLRTATLESLFPTSPECDGARDFCALLAREGLRQAVATSSTRRLYEMKISQHGPWFKDFDVIVTGDDKEVGQGKPAPDIFLLAAARLGAEPADCVVFEDSPAGVQAARAAGMRVVALPDPLLGREKVADADLVVDSFRDLRLTDLWL
jgi:pseudouridine-5'-monophosphatase